MTPLIMASVRLTRTISAEVRMCSRAEEMEKWRKDSRLTARSRAMVAEARARKNRFIFELMESSFME